MVTSYFHLPYPRLSDSRHSIRVTDATKDSDGNDNPHPTVRVAVTDGDGNEVTFFVASYHQAFDLAAAFTEAAGMFVAPACTATMWDENEYGRYPLHDGPCTIHDSTGARFLSDMDEVA